MAERSERLPFQCERDQFGCMWGIISMFDFRHGRSTQKLLSDRMRWSRHIVDTGSLKDELHRLTNPDENSQGTFDGVKSTTAGSVKTGKPSVKKLIEYEMSSEQGSKKDINNAEVESKQPNAGGKKKNRTRRSKSRSESYEMHVENLNVAENLGYERSCPQHSEHFPSSLDIGRIIEEFCCQIHQKSINWTRHGQHGEVDDQLNQKNPGFEEKLSEAFKLFISQKLINGNNIGGDSDINPSTELRDAIQFLSSDEELFQKILQVPKSAMVNHVQNWWNGQVEKDKNFRSLVSSNLSKQEINDFKQLDIVTHSKTHKFFGRKAKPLEERPSKAHKASNQIVILKPRPSGLQNSETECSLVSSSQSQFIVVNKEPSRRVGSHLFLAGIRRKLKHAMGKEQPEISRDGILKRLSNECQAMDSSGKGFNEKVHRKSLSKDHFFIEEIAQTAMGVEKGEETGNMKQNEVSMEHGTATVPKQRISNIYIEAKKHLSEMLSNGNGDADFSSEQVPKSLGRILSLPDYNFSPMGSPARDLEQSFVTAQMRFTANEIFHKQEHSVSQQAQETLNLESQSCVSDDNPGNDEQDTSNPNLSASNELLHDDRMVRTFSSNEDKMPFEGDVEIVKATEILDQEEKKVMDTHSEQSDSSITREDQNKSSQHHSCEQNQPQFSPLIFPSISSITKKVEDIDGFIGIPERQSPVSVLEPTFTEDEVSPASTRSQAVELPIQPLRIQFEELDSSAADPGGLKTCTEDTESLFQFVKAVLQASGMNWDVIHMKSHSSEQLLDPSLFDEVEALSSQLHCDDKKLLFDCINEVLVEVYDHYFGCILGLSIVKPITRPVPDMKHAIHEVWERVHWHLLPLPLPHTLDQIVKKDMAKTGTWMDLRCDAETIIFLIGEAIFEDLTEEIVSNCINESSESGNLLMADLKENESSINL